MAQKQDSNSSADPKWWAANRSQEQAIAWHEGLFNALDSLANNPQRFAISRENDRFTHEIREMHYGLGPRATHRAVFTIAEPLRRVFVLTIRHSAQPDLLPSDVD